MPKNAFALANLLAENISLFQDGFDPTKFTAALPPAGPGVRHVLGDLAFGKAGETYRLVRFRNAVAYAEGQVCCWSAGEWDVTNDLSANLGGDHPAGIVQGSPTQDQIGWIQTSGYATIRKTAGNNLQLALGGQVVPSGDGLAAAAGAGSGNAADVRNLIGACVAAAVATATTVRIKLSIAL